MNNSDSPESQIRELLTPTSTVNRDQLLYDCGYHAAKVEFAGGPPSEPELTPANSLARTAPLRDKLQLPHWISLVSTITAITLGLLLWQKSGSPSQLALHPPTPDAVKQDSANPKPEVLIPMTANSQQPTGRTRPQFATWLGINLNPAGVDSPMSIDNLPDHGALSASYNANFRRPKSRSTEFTPATLLPRSSTKSQRQLFNELTETIL